MPKAKIVSIISVVTLLAILFWLSLIPWLKEGAKFQHIGVWLPPLLALAVLVGAMAIGILLLDQKRLWVLMAVLAGLPIFLFFEFQYLYLLFLGFLVLFVLGVGRDMKRELAERYKLDIRVMARSGMRYLVMPFLIAISFIYFFSPQIQVRAREGVFPKSFQQSIASGVQQFIDQSGEAPPGVNTKAAAVQATNTMFSRINAAIKPYREYFPPLLAFGLFIVLWGVAFIFTWLGTLIARLIFYILRKTNFVMIEEKDVKAQIIKL